MQNVGLLNVTKVPFLKCFGGGDFSNWQEERKN
ncbi:hypothetical protein [Listeria phage FHC174-PLM34]|nr:hypothetical protein [Listeria phage FHC174-PLM34]